MHDGDAAPSNVLAELQYVAFALVVTRGTEPP
jgi:hypothetical protein